MSIRALAPVAAAALLAVGCKKNEAATPRGNEVPGAPVETELRNAIHQEPAFAGQTRVPLKKADVDVEVTTIAKGLEHPWAVAFLADGGFLVTERPGRLRIVGDDGALSPPVTGLPEVDARGQGGLLDVVIAPDAKDRIYFCYAEPRDGGNGTAVAKARLVRDAAPRLEEVEVIWRMMPTFDSTKHFGCRIVFARDGNLFVGLGERSDVPGRIQAQLLESALGKVVRIRPDGKAPDDNPFVGQQGALPEIWSRGHRNIQAAALHPETGALWVVEHGARGGDELNIVEKGKDYGWPTIAYGIEYIGDKIGKGITRKEGMEQPIYYWDPVIAPSGMAFYTADLFPAWKGSVLVGSLKGQHIARLTLDGDRVVGEERLLPGRGRVRDVRVGPDGAVYVLTDEEDGHLMKLTPRH
jgi:glucose/arabinose dehydrogenase